MKTFRQLCAICVLFVSSIAAQKNDWLIVPGQRVGPISATTTRAELDNLFGKENVRDDGYQGEELEAATIVLGDDPTAALAVTWDREHVSRVYVCFKTKTGPCRWRTASGIRIGLPIRELEKLNGKSFQFDASGAEGFMGVMSWRNGALEENPAGCGHLIVQLSPQAELEGRNLSKEESKSYKQLQNGKKYSSSFLPLLELDFRVSALTMNFLGPACGNKTPG